MEGSSKHKQHQPKPQSKSVGDEEDEGGCWESTAGGSSDDIRGEGRGDGKHRRARSLIKMLGNSFTKSEVGES